MKINRSSFANTIAAFSIGVFSMAATHAAETISVVTFGGAYEPQQKKRGSSRSLWRPATSSLRSRMTAALPSSRRWSSRRTPLGI